MSGPTPTPRPTPEVRTAPDAALANERLKDSFGAWLWGSMIVATVVHFGAFALWPSLTAEVTDLGTTELDVIEIPDEIELPPEPEPLTTPALPVPGPTDLDENLTIEKTTLEANPPSELPPPPEEETVEMSTTRLVPYTVPPTILNTDEIVRAMERAYPTFLRDAGIGGTVHVRFHIDERGTVRDYRLDRSSGQEALDDAALAIADLYRFSPALNRDQHVAVWVSFPITFRVRE